MALCAQIIDAGTVTPRPVRWGWWHLTVLTDLARKEAGMSEDTPLLEVWSINGGHHEVGCAIGYRDPADGEVFILNPGDVIEIWRDR
jgi:hypothetical protein